MEEKDKNRNPFEGSEHPMEDEKHEQKENKTGRKKDRRRVPDKKKSEQEHKYSKSDRRKKNEEIAQDEWEEAMRKKNPYENRKGNDVNQTKEGSDLSLWETKGKQRNILLKKIKDGSSELKEESIRMVKQKVTQDSVMRTDTGKGIRFAKENVAPFLLKASDLQKGSVAFGMRMDLKMDSSFQNSMKTLKSITNRSGESLFSRYDSKHLSMKDIKSLRKESVASLEKLGICKLKAKEPKKILLELKIREKRGEFTSEKAKALCEVIRQTAKIETARGKQKPRMYRFTRKKLIREMRKDDTGRELANALEYGSISTRFVKKMIRNRKEKSYRNLISSKESIIGRLQARITYLEGRIKNKRLRKKIKPSKKLKTPALNHRRLFGERMPGPTGRRGVRFLFSKKKKDTKKKAGKKAGSSIRRTVSRATRAILEGIKEALDLLIAILDRTGLLKYIVIFLAILLLIIGVIAIILGIVSAVSESVNFDSKTETRKNLCFETIEECYQNQMDILSNYNSSGMYSNVIIKNNDLKSNQLYEQELPYTETTNITELISMATIYFEGDLSSPTDKELTDYLRGMYYGSHVITASDDGSDSVTVTVTTYYFDDLFDVSPSSYQSNGSVISGTRIDIPQTFTQTTTYEPYNYENMDGKHYWSYTCRPMWKAWTDQGQLADDGLCYMMINGTKFYLVAVYEPTFGKVGDYIDFYFPDNNYVMHCIIADTKGADEALYKASNGIIYGHKTGSNSCSVIEFMLKYQSRGHAGSFTHGYGGPGHPNWHPEMSGNALYAVNGGSYFTSPGGPQFSYSESDGSVIAETYLNKLSEISNLIKTHSSLFRKGKGKNCTYKEMRKRVSEGKGSIYIDCGKPSSWALQAMGLISNDVYISDGQISGGAKALIRTGKVMKITDGLSGKTIKAASDQNLLKPGDILLCGGAANHTATYAGKNAQGHLTCYEAGGYANGKGYSKVGCGPLDYNSQTQYRIVCVLRWK